MESRPTIRSLLDDSVSGGIEATPPGRPRKNGDDADAVERLDKQGNQLSIGDLVATAGGETGEIIRFLDGGPFARVVMDNGEPRVYYLTDLVSVEAGRTTTTEGSRNQ